MIRNGKEEDISIDEVQVGDEVIGGTLNRTGRFMFEARKVGRKPNLAQIIKLVADAQGSKAPIHRLPTG